MTETERIMDQLERAFLGEAWHGPSIREILTGINNTSANTLPMKGVHTIWEIVLHMSAWIRLTVLTLEGDVFPSEVPPEQDWPPVDDTAEEAWDAAVHELYEVNQRLNDHLLNFSDDGLGRIVPGKDFSWYILLNGLLQHNVYHAGQMAMIKSSLMQRK